MQKNNNELFTTMPVGKAVAKLAIPTVISQIVVILYSLADTFFVGQIGDPNQLAALSITFPIFTLLTAVANLFGIGANSVIARSLGKNDQDTAKKASAFGFWVSFGVTAILAIILGLFMKPILTFFKADELTFSFSARYLLWVFVIGGLPTVAGLILGHLVRAVGKTKEAGIGLSLGGIMNIILDPIFIFEKGGYTVQRRPDHAFWLWHGCVRCRSGHHAFQHHFYGVFLCHSGQNPQAHRSEHQSQALLSGTQGGL